MFCKTLEELRIVFEILLCLVLYVLYAVVIFLLNILMYVTIFAILTAPFWFIGWIIWMLFVQK